MSVISNEDGSDAGSDDYRYPLQNTVENRHTSDTALVSFFWSGTVLSFFRMCP